MRIHVGPLLFVLLAVGCTTTLKTKAVLPTDKDMPAGILYQLPKTALDATFTFLPTQCYIKGNGQATMRYELTTAQVSQRFIPDPNEVYVLEYAALNSPMKITTANITLHPSGMIKSINADVDDRSAQVVASTAGIAINIAKAAAYPGALIGVASALTTKPCPKPIADRLDQFRTLRNKVIDAGGADEELEKQKTEFGKAQLALDAAKVKLAASPQDGALLTDFKTKDATVARLTAALKDQKPQLPKAQSEWDAVMKALTAKASGSWEPAKTADINICKKVSLTFKSYVSQLIDADTTAEAIDALDNLNFGTANSFEGWVCIDPDAAHYAAVPTMTGGTAAPPALTSGTGAGNAAQGPRADGAIKETGVVYRLPQMAKIVVKKTQDGDPLQGTGDTWISVPQFGVKASLPLKNRAFDKNNLKAAFAEDGSLASLDFTAQSSAERGAAAMQDLSKSYVELLSERDKSRKARLQAQDTETKKLHDDEITQYDAQIAVLNKRRELEVTRSGGKDRMQIQIDATAKETELIGKQIELEKKRQELEKLKSPKP